ncbi:MAG: hypothetical protein VW683_10670 [Betaproteobacteria bacterium]|jgi:hypothetical protein
MKNELETTEVMPGQFEPSPFPMDLETQKRLLELIYNRKSGIITRQELINVIFNTENTPSGNIIRYRA